MKHGVSRNGGLGKWAWAKLVWCWKDKNPWGFPRPMTETPRICWLPGLMGCEAAPVLGFGLAACLKPA